MIFCFEGRIMVPDPMPCFHCLGSGERKFYVLIGSTTWADLTCHHCLVGCCADLKDLDFKNTVLLMIWEWEWSSLRWLLGKPNSQLICTQHVLIMVNSISKVLCDLLLTCGMCNYPCIPSQPSEMPLLRKIDSSTWMYFDKLLLCPPLHGGSCFSPLRRPVHRGGGVIHPNPIIATASPPMRRWQRWGCGELLCHPLVPSRWRRGTMWGLLACMGQAKAQAPYPSSRFSSCFMTYDCGAKSCHRFVPPQLFRPLFTAHRGSGHQPL